MSYTSYIFKNEEGRQEEFFKINSSKYHGESDNPRSALFRSRFSGIKQDRKAEAGGIFAWGEVCAPLVGDFLYMRSGFTTCRD